MSIFFTTLKSMTWGLCILVLLILTIFSATGIAEDFGRRIPSDTHEKVAALYQVVRPKLIKLEDAYYSNQSSTLIREQKNQLPIEIREDIKRICENCQLKSFFPSSGYEVIALSTYLETRMKKDSTEENNITYTIAGISSLLEAILCIYLIIGLVKFRNNAKYASILILAGIPIVLCLLAGSSLYMDETWFYTKFGGPNERNLNFLFFSVFYFFVGYPAIYAVAKKWHIGLKNVLSLKP
jgi:hypothetical protein